MRPREGLNKFSIFKNGGRRLIDILALAAIFWDTTNLEHFCKLQAFFFATFDKQF